MIKIKLNMKKCNNLFYKIIVSVTFFMSIFIYIGAITNAHDHVFINVFSSAMRFTMPVMLAAIICLFIAILYRSFDTFSRRQLIVSAGIMFCIMTLIFVIILYNFCSIPYSDARNVQDMAMYFAKTGKHSVGIDAPHAVYFEKYSNNYFLTIVFVYLFKAFLKLGICDVYATLQIMTAIGIMTATVFMYLIGMKICGLCGGVKVLLLCVLNPVYYVLILWVYTNVISIPFMMAVIYFGICIYKEKRKNYLICYCILEAVSSVIGYFVRPTVVIPLIALVICAFLRGCAARNSMHRLLKCSVICVVTGAILFQMISKLNDSYFYTVSEGNYPITHWLMMGSHNDGRHNIADVKYTKSFDTKKEKTEATIKKTIENYRSHRWSGLISFLGDKLLFSWGLGDGDEIILKASQDKKQTKLYSWVIGDRKDLFRLYCYSFRIANVCLIMIALWELLKKKEIDAYQFLFVLSLFGGILFYCFWEVKGSYTAPFIYIMLLIGMSGGDLLAHKIAESCKQITATQEYSRAGLFVIVSCIACVCIVSYYKMTDTDILRQDRSLYCSMGNSTGIVADNEVSEVSQEFYTSKPMNRIVFGIRTGKRTSDLNVGYQVILLEEDKREVYKGEIYAKDIRSDGTIVLEMEEIVPRRKKKYTLQFHKIYGMEGMLYFQQQSNAYMDTYEGTLTVNGKKRMNDMHLQVYKEYESKWCSKQVAFIINGGIFVAAFLMFLWLWNGENIRIKRKGVEEHI